MSSNDTGSGMPSQMRIIRRIPSVFDSPSALHLIKNADHSSSSILPALRPARATYRAT